MDEGSDEGKERGRLTALARSGVGAATNPASPDLMNFSRGRQPLVDLASRTGNAARAERTLAKLGCARATQRHRGDVVLAADRCGRERLEAVCDDGGCFLHRADVERNDARLFEGIRKHRDWYVGDGMYGDGPEFHWDYYNSSVIQPMLVEQLDGVGVRLVCGVGNVPGESYRATHRYAAIQKRTIAPDGSFPAIGRSLAYRGGAMQGLALAELRKTLSKDVSPAQARVALTSVIRRTMEAPGTFDAKGWLTIGLAGRQPGLGETYISTGSLYLCSVALLPLGLPASDPFWSMRAAKTTWERIWSGENLPVDKAIKSPR